MVSMMESRFLIPFFALAFAVVASLAFAEEAFIQLADGTYLASGTLNPPNSGPVSWDIEVLDGDMRFRQSGTPVHPWSIWFEWADESSGYSGTDDGWIHVWQFGNAGSYQHDVLGAQSDSGTYE
jgi:hypothetical protein